MQFRITFLTADPKQIMLTYSCVAARHILHLTTVDRWGKFLTASATGPESRRRWGVGFTVCAGLLELGSQRKKFKLQR